MGEKEKIRIAMIGSKGLPAIYGGIERHIEEIGSRLASRGHEITVFGRKPFSCSGEHRGMKVQVLPSIQTKNLDTATNSLITCFNVLFKPFDILHFHGVGPSIFITIPASAGRKTVSTIHALDYRQQKWGRVAKKLLKKGEKNALRSADAVIAVSRLMAGELGRRYGRKVDYIPNGASLPGPQDFSGWDKTGLERDKYILTVGRFIVEREFHTLIEAFSGLGSDLKLVIVGDERFQPDYAAHLHSIAGENVVFAGYQSGERLEQLYAHCAFYVLPSLIEGLPISLMEAMSHSRPVLISDIPENLEVAGEIAPSFRAGDMEDLRCALGKMAGLGEGEKKSIGALGRARIESEYNWDDIAVRTEQLYYSLLDR